MQERKQIGILLIATNKYKQFVQPLLDTIEKYFLVNHDVTIFLFTDDTNIDYRYKGSVIKTQIPPYRFPAATLYRYRIFDDNKILFDQIDYTFYLDVDMSVVDYVGDEILGDSLTVTRHPGFFNGGWGSQNVDPNSKAFVPEHLRGNYYAGGFNGGTVEHFLEICSLLSNRINDDEKNGIIAEHNDESHLNWLLAYDTEGVIILDSGYCMVEDVARRKAWGIDHLDVKIIALNKNHSEIRS